MFNSHNRKHDYTKISSEVGTLFDANQIRPHSLADPFKSIFGGKEKIIQAAIFYEQNNGLYFYYRVKA